MMTSFLYHVTLLLTISTLIPPNSSLTCYWCSEFQDGAPLVEAATACPQPSDDPVAWSRRSGKYYDLDGQGGTDIVCGVGYSQADGRVYYQVRGKCFFLVIHVKYKYSVSPYSIS